jgi:parallel beta-helix repeat protein
MSSRKSQRPHLETLEARETPSVYYVAPTGADNASGSITAPWKTLQHAVDTIKPGDTILVESGTYAGFRITHSTPNGSESTIEAAPGVVVTVNAPGPLNKHNSDIEVENFGGTVSNWTIAGFHVINSPHEGIDVRGTNNITVENNVVSGSAKTGIFLAFSDHPFILDNTSFNNLEHGIYDSNSGDYPTISGNTLYGNASCGIHMNGDISQGGDGIISSGLISDNVIYNNGTAGGSGINCDGVQNSVIENNLLYDNHASGISLYRIDGGGPSTGNIVVNNTIDMPAGSRWALNIQNASTGNTAYNNILINHNTAHGSINISSDSLPGFTSDYNIVMNVFTANGGNSNLTLAQWRATTGEDKHSFTASPTSIFVNEAANNYQLLPTSAAIDRGTNTDAPSTDIRGKPRPLGGVDIGCYEY